MSEEELQATIVEAAQRLGFLVHHTRPARTARGEWRTPVQGDVGFPDLLLARHPGLVFAWELKSARGRLGIMQETWGRALGSDDARGAELRYDVIRPGNLDEALARLQDAARGILFR